MRILLLITLCSVTLTAQTTIAPELSREQLSELQRWDLLLENAALRLELIKTQRQAIIDRLQQDKFDLVRNQDGAWSFVPKPGTK